MDENGRIHIVDLRKPSAGIDERTILLNDAGTRDAVVPVVLLEDTRIAEIAVGNLPGEVRRLENRVVRHLLKVDAVRALREALALLIRLSCRVDKDQLAVLLDRAAGAAAADGLVGLIRDEGERKNIPFYKILCCDMGPVHGAPARFMRVMLEKEMPFPLVPDKAVGVIAPPGCNRHVVFRTIRLFFTHILSFWALDPCGRTVQSCRIFMILPL